MAAQDTVKDEFHRRMAQADQTGQTRQAPDVAITRKTQRQKE